MLWRRVNRGLSAGRVQSPSIRLIVERERERIAFVTAGYWDIDAAHRHRARRSRPRSSAVDGTKVATGKDFGSDGRPKADVVVLDEAGAPSAWPTASPTADVHASARSRRSRTAASPEGAVHDLHPPAGGRPQAAPRRARR